MTFAPHERLGFERHTDEFAIPGVEFAGGRGILFRLLLGAPTG